MEIVICEDILQHADYLASMIEKYFVGKQRPTFHIYEHCGRFLDLFRSRKINYDAIFLDIKMPGINGLDAARHIRFSDESVPIVFITSALEYAKEGYDYDAVSFLLKPVDESKLFQTLYKIEKRRSQLYEQSMLIESENYVFRVPFSNIVSIQRSGRKTEIHRSNGKPIYSNQPISVMVGELKLKPEFVIAYQTDYVNLRYVIDIDKKRRTIMLSDGRELFVGRNRLHAILEAMIALWGEDE